MQSAQLKEKILKDIKNAASLTELEEVRVAALGKKGSLTLLMKELSNQPPEDRKVYGAELNAIKEALQAALDDCRHHFEEREVTERLAQEKLDVSLPPPGPFPERKSPPPFFCDRSSRSYFWADGVYGGGGARY